MKEQATEEAVWTAADELQASGHEPTVLLLRERVGGSFTTVQKHLRTWQDKQRQVQAIRVPESIQRLADQLAREVWRSAQVETQAAISQAQQTAQAAIAAIEKERDQALSEIARLEADAETRSTELDVARTEMYTMRDTLAEARAHAQTEAARATELERQLTSVQTELEHARARSVTQLAEAVAAIQQQLTQQAAHLQRMAQGRTEA